MPDRPNILILMADQHQQATLGCSGHPVVQTPHIDSLAEAGTRFANAFTTCPLCGPARASLLTGTHPHTNGFVTHPNGRHRSGKRYRPQLQAGIGSLVAELRDAGYRTHATGYIGCHHCDGERNLDHDLEWLGFQTEAMRSGHYRDRVGQEVAGRYNLGNIKGEMWEPSYANVEGEAFPYPEEQMWDSLIAEAGAEFLAGAPSEQPWLLYCGFRAPHTPWCPPARFLELYDPANIGPLPDYRVRHHHVPRRLQERCEYFDIRYYPEELVRRSIAAYCGFVSYLDHCVGQVLAALDRTGQRDKTIVVYCADHGELCYQHGLCEKHCFFEDAVRVPLILSGPGLPRGRATESLASLMDLLPTLLARADVPVPGFAEGLDLAPAFAGGTVREHVLAEYYHSLDPCRMVRDQRYKYVHTEDDICELYDLRHDPGELLNLAWYPQYAKLVKHYEQLVMADWEIPEVPLYAAWNDLNERKQRQRLQGLDIIDTRPPLPDWAQAGPES